VADNTREIFKEMFNEVDIRAKGDVEDMLMKGRREGV
jgi:hypothetical protein